MVDTSETIKDNNYSKWEAQYLERMASSEFGRSYKDRMLTELDIRPGQTAIDLGCGIGMDLSALADAVTDTGAVMGFDHDPRLVTRAQERIADQSWVQVQLSDIHALPLRSASVHRARADRVLQHVTEPARVLAELRRVLQESGRVVLGEPDWHTLSIDYQDLKVASTYTRYITDEIIRNPAIGRQLPRFAEAAGLQVVDVLATTALFRDFTAADRALSIRRFTQSAVGAGYFSEDTAQTWLRELATGDCFASVNFYTIVAVLRHN